MDEQFEATDRYRMRLNVLFEKHELSLQTTMAEKEQIYGELAYDNPCLILYQYRAPTKQNFYNLLTNTTVLTNPKRFNDIFDSYLYCNKDYFESIFSSLDVNVIRQLVNTLRERELSQEEVATWGLRSGLEVLKRLSEIPKEEVEDKFFNKFDKVKAEGWEGFCRYVKAFAGTFLEGVRISCFSEVGDSPLMWGQYADSGRGFCIRYKVKPFLNKAMCKRCGRLETTCEGKPAILSLLPVIYRSERFDCARVVERYYDYFMANMYQVKNDFSTHDMLEAYKVACFKSNVWSYEREWRLILEYSEGVPDYFGAQVFLPDAIYLGPKIEEADEVLLVQTINNMKQTLGYELPIYRMVSNWGQRYYILEAEEYRVRRHY